ncbi:MAG: beta-propeller fold lactonase family protein [Actinomycetota bacterium]
MEGTTMGAVYVQTNEPDNRVIAFRRGPDGALTELGSYTTGGKGEAAPHLTSQGSVIVTQDGRHVLVTNAASDDLSVFAVSGDGLELVATIPTGAAPKSVTERAGAVFVLNTGAPSVSGFRIADGGIATIEGSEMPLAAGADPAQIGFTRDGTAIVITERGTDAIETIAVGSDGMLGERRSFPSAGPTPYGFAISNGGTLVVTEAFRAEKGAAAASSYGLAAGTVSPVTGSVGNGRSEICWAVITDDGRFAFTTNFADGAISRYAIAMDGALSLEDATAGITEDGRAGLRDEDLSTDGRFLYALDADAGRVFGWSVGEGGLLDPVGSWGSLPMTVAGLAAS